MSSLTGQQIKDTYEGLLKLADSTTGITSSLQAIQDGLGNNTGARIATNLFTAPNVPNINGNLVIDYGGNGMSNTAFAYTANTQNRVLYGVFYDSGISAYSAITYTLNTLSTTSDVVNVSFYTLQLVPNVGVAPKDLIMSGITIDSFAPATTGVKTSLLPSTLSFSGFGGGNFIVAVTISNANATPTVRYNTVSQTAISFPDSLGYYLGPSNQLLIGSRAANLTKANVFVIDNLPQQVSYSVSDITTNLRAGVIAQLQLGFGLKTIQ